MAQSPLRVKNQVTVPETIVEILGARPRDTLVFEADPGAPGTARIVLVRRTYAGSMPGIYGRSEDVIAFLREECLAWGD